MTVYEYRTLRVARASWPRLGDAFAGSIDVATRAAGGSVYALCAGMIGFATDEGTIIRAWPDEETLSRESERTLAGAETIVESSVSRLMPAGRPVDATPPRTEGVYAHRWFWLDRADWDEFLRLSEDGIWPYFESDGCGIIGLWRELDERPQVAALLITRYPSVAHWERTRLQSRDAPPGADAALYRRAQEAGRRRAALTERSIVRLTRLVPLRGDG